MPKASAVFYGSAGYKTSSVDVIDAGDLCLVNNKWEEYKAGDFVSHAQLQDGWSKLLFCIQFVHTTLYSL